MTPAFERQRCLLDFAAASLLRRKGKNGALVVVYTLVVFLAASVLLFTQALKREAALVLEGAPDLVVQRSVTGRYAPLPESYRKVVEAIRGVSDVRSRLWGSYYDPAVGATYTVSAPRGFAHGAGDAVIGAGLSRVRQTFEGDRLFFRAADGSKLSLTVREILPAASELVSSDLVLVSESAWRTLFGVAPGTVTDLALTVPNPRETATVAATIVERLPDARPLLRSESLRTYDAVFDWRGGLCLAVLGGSLLAFAILAWDKATGLSSEEQREVGILKAVGWETSDVLLLKFWEGTVLSLSSFLAGGVLAYGHVFLAGAPLFTPVLKGWSVLYPSFRLTPAFEPEQWATLFLLTVVPYTVATLVPSWRVATTDPDSVMR